MLYVGNSSVGKSGSLVSLVQAGYKIGMLDLDNGIDVLLNYVRHLCPDLLGNIKYVSLRDLKGINKMNQMKVVGQPKAFINAMKFTQEWDDGTKPSEWGPEWIFVVDTLSTLSLAAHDWAEATNPTAKEPRSWINLAQRGIESYISGITGVEFNTNVIVISHLAPGPKEDIEQKLFAASIGRALGPHLGKYFNNLLCAESTGSGEKVKRVIRTLPTNTVDLKTSAPFLIDGTLPLESGLATIFEKLKGNKS